MYQSIHDAFVRLETRGSHVHNRREEDVEQEGHVCMLTSTGMVANPARGQLEQGKCFFPIPVGICTINSIGSLKPWDRN